MSHHTGSLHRLVASLIVVFCALLASLLPAASARAAPPREPAAPTTVELAASEDAGVIESFPDFKAPGNPYFVLNARPGGDYDHNFIQFDLSVLPANATACRRRAADVERDYLAKSTWVSSSCQT